MTKYECSASVTTTLELNIVAADRYEAAGLFRVAHDRYPDCVGDDLVVGACEGCERALFEGDDFYTDPDGVRMCATCLPPEELARLNAEAEKEEEQGPAEF